LILLSESDGYTISALICKLLKPAVILSENIEKLLLVPSNMAYLIISIASNG